MNELLIWILAVAVAAGVVLLLWLGRRRQQRARDAADHREAQRLALEEAEHIARAQRLAAERDHAGAPDDLHLDAATQARRMAEDARLADVQTEREADDIARRVAEAEAARLARGEPEAHAAEVARLAREQAEREAAEAAEAAAAARRAEEAEAERAAAEARAREEAERLAREQAEREAAEAARRAAEEAAERAAAEARAREEAERLAREQAEHEAAEAARRAAEEAAERAAAEARVREEAERLAREQAEREAAEAARRAAEEAAAEARAREAAEAAAAAVATRELRVDETLILVADDSKIVRVKLSRLLAGKGYRVELAESGEQALEHLAAERPHVLITDVEMPGIDGFELTRQVRAGAATATLPVLMITSSDDKQDKAAAAGVTQLLGKPFSEEALLAAIERARVAVRVPA
ncbi:response regulator [Roseateles cellulosilyticus]|uniref:Response regulator n=1 Tax=Pelomonas cellulosilytica TaxID=2906762 RepID=A0ABS8XPF5_9BURK|nr:response regulator [Pelomonas sp. P8]MCE4553625.1 response regulator [Pelomonas sp. P8]